MLSLRTAFFGVLGFAAIVACASKNEASSDGKVCTAGNFVYCRCEDRSEGTKLCHDDGKSFDPCKCDGTGGPVTEYDAGPLEPYDAGGPAQGLHIDNACAGKLAVVAGAKGSPDVYLTTYKGDGVFEGVKGAGSVAGPISVLPAGGALVASYKGSIAILTTKYAGGAWSPLSAIGTADVTTYAKSATGAALYNGAVKLLFIGGDDHYHVATYNGSGWDDGSPTAEFSGDAGTTLPGKSAPAVAAAGTQLVAIISTNDGALARETYADFAWGPWIKVPENAAAIPPAVAALESGSAKDLLLVWSGTDGKLHSASRDALSKTWSNGSLVDTTASSNAFTIAPLPNGDALVIFVGIDDKGYVSRFSAASGFAPPAELVPGANPKLAGVPSATRGHCGEDASIVYAEDGGAVKIVRYTGTKVEGPYEVPGIPKATIVGIGELL